MLDTVDFTISARHPSSISPKTRAIPLPPADGAIKVCSNPLQVEFASATYTTSGPAVGYSPAIARPQQFPYAQAPVGQQQQRL